MATETRRCTQCGNEIPDWSGRVCPVCERITRGEKRFWPRGKKRHRSRLTRRPSPIPPLARSARRPKKMKIEPGSTPDKSGPAKKRLRRGTRDWRRLEGFNRLLKDVYGQPVRLSHLLAQQGIPKTQTRRWQQDGIWLVRFMKRLERELLFTLVKAVPRQDPRVLDLWYGLDGRGNRRTNEIATELGMAAVQVRVAQRSLLRYLRGQAGRARLEQIVLAAAQETQGQ